MKAKKFTKADLKVLTKEEKIKKILSREARYIIQKPILGEDKPKRDSLTNFFVYTSFTSQYERLLNFIKLLENDGQCGHILHKLKLQLEYEGKYLLDLYTDVILEMYNNPPLEQQVSVIVI